MSETNDTPLPPTPKPDPKPADKITADYDPVADSADMFERLLGAPHKNLEDALLSHGFTLDRIFHRLAMYGAGSKAKTIDKNLMELALQTQLQFRRTYETKKRIEREDQQDFEKYTRTRNVW